MASLSADQFDDILDENEFENTRVSDKDNVHQDRLKHQHGLVSRRNMNSSIEIDGQPFDYIAVIDFEATCEENAGKDYRNEIIEFPIVLIDVERQKIVDQFHSYCRPREKPTLSKFCIELTGIKQKKIDGAPCFADVLQKVEIWFFERNLLNSSSKKKVAFATDGPWDFAKFLTVQCKMSSISYPKWAERWINIRKHYAEFYRVRSCGIGKMLRRFGLEFDGRLHSGIDDSINIARIAIELLKGGCILSYNDALQN